MDELSDGIAAVVRAVERSSERLSPKQIKEIREQITRVGLQEKIPPRRLATRKPPPKHLQPRKPAAVMERRWSIIGTLALDWGEYETAQEIARGGASVVYAARRATESGSQARLAIKATEPPLIWTPEQSKAHVHDFMKSASLQKRVADAHPHGNWAPIYGDPVDSAGRGAHYVTSRYAITGEDLASPRRESIAEENLWRLVSGVVDGLEQLEQTAERPHGNLKAGNVLLARRRGRYKAFLADPLADETVARKMGRAEDLHQLGDIIRRLVLRDTGAKDAATKSLVGAESAWSHLGAGAPRWREFCEKLLNKGSEYSTFEAVRRELKPLRPANRKRKVYYAAAASIAGLAIGAAIYLYPPRFYDAGKWEKLCNQFVWYKDALPVFRSFNPALAGTMPNPDEIDPQKIAGLDISYEVLAGRSTIQRPAGILVRKGIIRTDEGVKAIDNLRGLLSDETTWSPLEEDLEKIKEDKYLCTPLRNAVNNRGDWVQGIQHDPPALLQTAGLLEADGMLKQVAAVIEKRSDIKKEVSDLKLAADEPFVNSVLAQVDRLNDEVWLKELQQFGEEVDLDLKTLKTVDDALRAQPKKTKWTQLIEDKVDDPLIEDIKDRTKFPDAAAKWAKAVTLDYAILDRDNQVQAKINTLDGIVAQATTRPLLSATDGDHELRIQFAEQNRELNGLRESAKNFQNKDYITLQKPDMEKERTRLLAVAETLEKHLQEINKNAQVSLNWPQEALQGRALAEKDGRIKHLSPTVQAIWNERKKKLINTLSSPPQPGDLLRVYRQVEITLAANVATINSMFSDNPVFPERWNSLNQIQSNFKESLLSELRDEAGKLDASSDIPQSLFDNKKDRWNAWIAASSAWVQRGAKIAADLMPDGGLHLVDDSSPNLPATQKLRVLWKLWLDDPKSNNAFLDAKALANSEFAKALANSQARYDLLTDVQDAPTPQKVLAMLDAKDDPAKIWAAWNAAGELTAPNWLPLRQEADARKAALAVVANVPSGDRKNDLNKLVFDVSTGRWLRWVVKTPTSQPSTQPNDQWPAGYDAIRTADELKGEFEITDAILKKPIVAYNLKLAEQIDAVKAGVDDPTALSIAGQFSKYLVGTDVTVQSQPVVGKTLSLLQKAIDEANNPKLKARQALLTPLEKSGWTKQSAGAGPSGDLETRMIFKHPTKPVQLEFVYVDPQSEAPPAYLLRSTVSIEWFNTLLPTDGPYAIKNKELPEPPVAGMIAACERTTDEAHPQLRVRRTWELPSSMMGDLKGVEKGDSDLEKPDSTLPVEGISAIVASKWAQSLGPGMRLPAVGEWQAARKMELGGRWNLRDSAWARDQVYYKTKLAGKEAEDLDPDQMSRYRAPDERDSFANSVWNMALLGPAKSDQYSDGAVLFVSSIPSAADKDSGRYGKTFFHIIGNVWQIVTDVQNGKMAYFVIGGSCLSPPEIKYDVPKPLQAKDEPFDVGFRVAFEAPLQPTRLLLTSALKKAEFLRE